jgi:hypothetical protein
MDDKFITLTQTAEILSAIIGNVATNELVVVEMPCDPCISEGLALQGWKFIGLLGLVEGSLRSAMAEEISADACDSLASVFSRQVARILAAKEQMRAVAHVPADDFVSWAGQLHALEDPRG